MVTLRNQPNPGDIIDYREYAPGQYEVLVVMDYSKGESPTVVWTYAEPDWNPASFKGIPKQTRVTAATDSILELSSEFNLEDQKKRLIDALNEEVELYRQQLPRRKAILALAQDVLRQTNRTFMGKHNEIYIGPDVTNTNLIFLVGAKANLPLKQMLTDGKRSSAVGRKPKAKVKTKSDFGI